MSPSPMSLATASRRMPAPLAALALLALGGCVAYPAYGPAGYGGYYAPGYAYAPGPVIVDGGGWYGGGGGWGGGHRGWHGGRGGSGDGYGWQGGR